MKAHALGRAREQGSTWSVTLKKPQLSPCIKWHLDRQPSQEAEEPQWSGRGYL